MSPYTVTVVDTEGCQEQIAQLGAGDKKDLQNFGGNIVKSGHIEDKYSWKTTLSLNLELNGVCDSKSVI
jgi:hypothetical protein